jgi:hypothetical protein
MILMENELDLLKQLKGAGERGRTIRTFDTRLGLDRLVKAGYVASQATGSSPYGAEDTEQKTIIKKERD